jgi:hypothetical protein
MNIPLDLTCWYLNSRRVMELVGAEELANKLRVISGMDGQLRKSAELAIQKNAVTEWLRTINPPPLGTLIAENRLKEGTVFTHYTNFFFNGLPAVRSAIMKNKPVPMAAGYAKLEGWLPDAKLTFKFSHEHLTSESAWHELSGQKRQLLLGLITSIEEAVIEATPYVVANPLSDWMMQLQGYGSYWPNHLEVHVDSIDTFTRVCDLLDPPSKSDLSRLRDVPEADIKNAFAEIIGEPLVPKDWAGEKSDLFSSRVMIDGNRISTAFVFKGPAQLQPMKMAQLGKNGDQIVRLFTEPADLFVLQHCHEITSPVRSTMRAFAQQTGRLRLFCIIDGYDTFRILKAYKKCGLDP